LKKERLPDAFVIIAANHNTRVNTAAIRATIDAPRMRPSAFVRVDGDADIRTNAKVSDRSQPPLTFDLSQRESTGSDFLDCLVVRSLRL
jgi:hypothetical protein